MTLCIFILSYIVAIYRRIQPKIVVIIHCMFIISQIKLGINSYGEDRKLILSLINTFILKNFIQRIVYIYHNFLFYFPLVFQCLVYFLQFLRKTTNLKYNKLKLIKKKQYSNKISQKSYK